MLQISLGRNEQLTVALALAVLLSALWHPGCGERRVDGVQSERCRPQFRRVSKNAISEEATGNLSFKLDAFLIGCEKDLAGLEQEHLEKVVEIVREVIKKEQYRLFSLAEEQTFRRSLSNSINEAIAQDAVEDVLICNLFSMESRYDIRATPPPSHSEVLREEDP